MNIIVDTSKYQLHTKRLVLRQWREDDLEDLFSYASVEGVGEEAGWAHHKDISKSKNLLGHYIRDKNNFAIEYRGKVIGTVSINRYNEKRNPEMDKLTGRELGFVLSKKYWGQGIMTEAVRKVVKWLFDEYNVDFIMCANFKTNKSSARVQEKCGFKFYQSIEGLNAHGNTRLSDLNILTRSEYEKIYKGL